MWQSSQLRYWNEHILNAELFIFICIFSYKIMILLHGQFYKLQVPIRYFFVLLIGCHRLGRISLKIAHLEPLLFMIQKLYVRQSINPLLCWSCWIHWGTIKVYFVTVSFLDTFCLSNFCPPLLHVILFAIAFSQLFRYYFFFSQACVPSKYWIDAMTYFLNKK